MIHAMLWGLLMVIGALAAVAGLAGLLIGVSTACEWLDERLPLWAIVLLAVAVMWAAITLTYYFA